MKKTNDEKKTKRRKNYAEMSFRNEDIVITDPCYLILEREDWLRMCGLLDRERGPQRAPEWCGRMIMASTLFGDWFCKVKVDNGRSVRTRGSFTADSGTVCVAGLTSEMEKALENKIPDMYWIVRGFTGKAKIVHARGECYVDLRGISCGKKFHAWSKQVG